MAAKERVRRAAIRAKDRPNGAMSKLKLKGVNIVETFAEAFPMVGTRIIITASTQDGR